MKEARRKALKRKDWIRNVFDYMCFVVEKKNNFKILSKVHMVNFFHSRVINRIQLSQIHIKTKKKS